MKLMFTSFIMGLALASHAQTPQWGYVYFDNAVLDNPAYRRVSVMETGMRLVGTNFIAELFYGTNASSMVRSTNGYAIGRFPPEGAPFPGTWNGGYRELVGIPPGTPTVMQVRIWNNDAAESFEEALQKGTNSPYLLFSSVFTYVPPPINSPPEAYYMSNFVGFEGDCGLAFQLRPSILVQPTNQTVRASDDVIISVVTSNAACYHQWQFNGTNINVLPGSRFLLLTNVQPWQAGEYRVILNGAFGGGITSEVARLTIGPPPPWGDVYFGNSVLEIWQRRLTFPSGELIVGTNFVAQLFYGTNDQNLIPVTNAPARFRLPTSSLAGSWIGGMRTLVGIPPGTPVRLQVQIWDGSWPYEEALSNGFVWGPYDYPAFNYTPPPHGSSLNAYYMSNFPGSNPLRGDCSYPQPGTAILEHPASRVVSVGETVILSTVVTNACYVKHWQFNGSNVLGQIFPKLRINNIQPHHQGDYRLIVFGGGGFRTSQVARITVRPPPQLASPRYDNGAFAFHVSEDTGRPIVIETAPDLDPETAWTAVFTNTAPFAFTNSTPADRQRYYRTVIR
jgi:hypothetical protein